MIQSMCPFPELSDYDASLEIARRDSKETWLHADDDSGLDADKFLFALALYRAGQSDKALLCLRGKLETKFFNEADRQLWRCRILADLDRPEEARQAYEAAQAYDANFPSSVDRGASACLITKRLFQECAAILERRFGVDLGPAIRLRTSGGEAGAMDRKGVQSRLQAARVL
jgi:hypothetical protein